MKKIKLTYLAFFGLILILNLSACKTKKLISSNNADVYVSDNNTQTNTKDQETKEDDNTVVNEEDYQENNIDTVFFTDTTTIIEEEKITKDVYKIALVLPFMEDSVRTNWNASAAKNYTNFQTPAKSESSISFYEGFLMGLKELKLHSKFKISVFDNKGSLYETTNIANKIADENFDVVICPFSSKNISELTRTNKNNNTIFISPFSPSTAAKTEANKFYILEPPINKHIETMIKYGAEIYDAPKITFFYHDNGFGQKSANYFTNYIDSLNKEIDYSQQITYAIIDISDKSIYKLKVEDYIDLTKDNVFIINSFDENAISVLLQKINAIDKKENNLITFGMPGWEQSEVLRINYLSNNQIHFTSSTWENNQTDEISIFNDNYKSTYKKMPENEVYLGYDLATIFIKTIDTYGINFDAELLKTDYKSYIKNYNFSKNINGRIENNALYIYKIEDFERILVK